MIYEEHGVQSTDIIISPSVMLGFKFQPVLKGVGESRYKLPLADLVEGGPGLYYVA